MNFFTTKSQSLMENALNARAMRQDMIAGNIANIDTPFYKARDISFESSLIEESKKMYNQKDIKELKMAQTNSTHLRGIQGSNSYKGTIFLRDGHTARNDGNTVDLDIETTELGKNSVMFTALTSALKKNRLIFRSVIDASSKV